MANYTTIDKSSLHMNNKLYTGNGSAGNAQTGIGFQPDLTWIKCRSQGHEHYLFDVVRGVTKFIKSNASSAESTASGVTAWGADGFTLGASDGMNENTDTFIAWNWKAGNSAGSSNSDGTVDSTVSVNTTAGFSIVKWTHTTSGNYTVGHGLGATPKMIIVKSLTATNWGVYHSAITAGNRLILNNTDTQSSGYWGANAWTNDTFSIGADRDSNGVEMVAYCWTPIVGYSSIGSYIGNGSGSGPVVYTGFKPSYVLIKKATGSAQDWNIYDNKRLGYNGGDVPLFADLDNAESTDSNRIDFLSNGFKIRTSNTQLNNDNSTYVFITFGQTIVSSNDIAATAR